jgi:hypothetical protein
MDEKDIELFIKAKKQQRVESTMTIVAALLFVVFTVLHALDTEQGSWAIALPMWTFLLLLSARQSLWVPVSREQLVNVIERQINRDPEALTTLTFKRNGSKLAS